MTEALRRRSTCRLCDAATLQRVISLGQTPLANAFVRAEERDRPQPQFPLEVYLCLGCGHAQLLDIVDPELLFRDYVYVSSTSPVFVEHFRRYAQAMIEQLHLRPGDTVVEIGSNDGVLLRCFRDAGLRVLGIDPARAIAATANASGIQTLPEFFDLALAHRLRAEGWAPALIVANNVFAHADDLHGITEGIAHLLRNDGAFVFEVSYLVDVIEHTLFDTIYHEHLSYHTVQPLLPFFARHGLALIDAQRVDTHGGSLRGLVQHAAGPLPRHAHLDALLAREQALGLNQPAIYQRFVQQIQQAKTALTTLLQQRKAQERRIAGFGAPAKATTLMYHFGLGPETLDYIIDDSPWKQGRFTPGHHIPIVPSSYLYNGHRPDDVLILAWNFADSIIAKHRAFHEAGGEFIVPLPQLTVR